MKGMGAMPLWPALRLAGNVCWYALWALWILSLIVSFATSWRQGRRVELWRDEEGRRRAALEAGASPVVADELARGNKIGAIKAYREETGAGLKESKDAVDRVEATLYRYEPWPSVWAALRGR